ncbi:MAG: YraN family protein [Clostridia bacterium]|nr:YraN family protein [Clostridia bacterium]
MNNLGKAFEEQACEYLKEKGYEILEQNYTCRYGEIDIVARQGKYTVFVEVKYRKNDDFCTPAEAITVQKLKKLEKAALDYIACHGESFYRFDAVCITGNEITHIENISYF